MEFAPLLVLMAINKKVVDFLKELLPNSLQNKVIQLLAWVVGVLTVWLFSVSDYAGELTFGKHTLADANPFTIIVVGIAIGSGAGIANDFIERRNPDAAPDPPD